MRSIRTASKSSPSTASRISSGLDAVDSWVYSAVFGKHVSRDEYLRFLTTIVRGLYHTGGVICGRGGHLILAGRDVLRVRIVGSIEACASRLSEQENISYTEAKRQVESRNKRRERFLWELFNVRYDDPTTFDIVVNTDNFRQLDDIVGIILAAVRARGFTVPEAQRARAAG